jgi:hypothetical protein
VPAMQYSQGLGVSVISSAGMTLVGHHGGVPGYETENETLPKQGIAWVVLSDAFDFGTYRSNRVVIGALFPSYVTNLAAATKATENRAVTRRFVDALAGLMRGSIDRKQYSDSANAALTPQLLQQSSAALDSLGDVTKVEFIGANVTSRTSLYEYKVTYSSGRSLTWSFVLDDKGKIADILGQNPT